MKVTVKLELEVDFDNAINRHLDAISDSNSDSVSVRTHRQELINLIRLRVHQAFKLGVKEEDR